MKLTGVRSVHSLLRQARLQGQFRTWNFEATKKKVKNTTPGQIAIGIVTGVRTVGKIGLGPVEVGGRAAVGTAVGEAGNTARSP